jgi:DnaJ family protein C protein 25
MPISIMKVCLLLAVCTHLPQLAEGVGKRSQKGALDLYCERENCYEVLGLDNTATKKEIKRSFRAISSKHHPDKKSKDPESPKIFAAAANAYEILTNDETRKNYDYYLAHPHEHATNQFAYYAMAAKKINVTPILICLIIVLTIIGYISRQFTYDSAVTNWKAQKRVIGRARREALKVLGPYKGKSRNGHEKELIEKEAEKWMNEQIEGHKIQEFPVKPDFHSLFAVQLLKFPYTLYQKCVWYHGFRR